jgi:hypothetical protein
VDKKLNPSWVHDELSELRPKTKEPVSARGLVEQTDVAKKENCCYNAGCQQSPTIHRQRAARIYFETVGTLTLPFPIGPYAILPLDFQ